MKLYLVRPNLPANTDRDASDARLRECVQPIADLIASSIEIDPCLYGLWDVDMIDHAPFEPESSFGTFRATGLKAENLRAVLSQVGDPFGGYGLLIRSMATCRSVRYGFDGEAFVCLRTEDPPIISPDTNLIVVEECSQLLCETDWMDGLSD